MTIFIDMLIRKLLIFGKKRLMNLWLTVNSSRVVVNKIYMHWVLVKWLSQEKCQYLNWPLWYDWNTLKKGKTSNKQFVPKGYPDAPGQFGGRARKSPGVGAGTHEGPGYTVPRRAHQRSGHTGNTSQSETLWGSPKVSFLLVLLSGYQLFPKLCANI